MNLRVALLISFSIQLIAQSKQERLVEAAEKKIQVGKFEEAKNFLNICIKDFPAYAEAYALRATVNENLQRPTDALTDYSVAIELSPTTAENYLNRGVLAHKLKRFDLAQSDFRKLLSLQKTETNTVYFRQSNNEGIDKIFTAQSGIKDMVYNYLGLIATELGETTKAILYFDSALQINPHSADYLSHRGLAYLKVDSITSAKQDFLKALQTDGNHAISKNNLATILKKEGHPTEAEKLLHEAKTVNNKLPEHYTNLALIQMEGRRYSEAILNLDSALLLDKGNGELYLDRGMAREKINDWPGAGRDYQAALQIDDAWPKAWLVQGNYFMKLKKWHEALENYTVAITLDENYKLAYYNRAIVNFQIGDKKKACDDLVASESRGMVIEPKMKLRFCN